MPWIKTGDFHWILVSSQDPRFKEYVRKLREERAREEEEATRGESAIFFTCQGRPGRENLVTLHCGWMDDLK